LPVNPHRFLHVATHGFVNHSDPNRSGLLFYPDSTSQEDHVLYSAELYGLQLNTDMVVLSACETGSGEHHPRRRTAGAFPGIFICWGRKPHGLTLEGTGSGHGRSDGRLSTGSTTPILSKEYSAALREAKVGYDRHGALRASLLLVAVTITAGGWV
jgi:hypothetical protein